MDSVNGLGRQLPLNDAYNQINIDDSIASPASRASATTEDTLSPSYCSNDNFFDDKVVGKFEEAMPAPSSVSGRVIDHLTNIYHLVGTLDQELCDNGRISGASAKELAGVAARSVTSSAVLYGTAMLAIGGAVVAGPVAVAGALGIGAVGLLVGPPAAEKLVKGAMDRIGGLFS